MPEIVSSRLIYSPDENEAINGNKKDAELFLTKKLFLYNCCFKKSKHIFLHWLFYEIICLDQIANKVVCYPGLNPINIVNY